MTTIALSNQLKGTLYCVFGVLTVTPDALLVRKVSDLPNFDVIFWKSLFFALMLLVCLLASQGIKGTIKVFKDVGWIGWVAGVVWGISTFAFNYAFQHTAAANVLVITAANPMFSAVGSYFLLKEHIPWRTIAAAVVCFVSIIVIFYGQLGSGDGDAMGLLNAVIASLTMGIYFVLIRYAGMQMGAEPDMMPCNIIAGFVVIIVVAPMCEFVGLTLYHLTILMINGMLILPISFTFLTIGPSLISAPEVSLYTLIETVLGPIWVWLGGYEAPPLSAVFGGTLLISALAIHSFVALREEKSPRRMAETVNLIAKDLEQDDVPL